MTTRTKKSRSARWAGGLVTGLALLTGVGCGKGEADGAYARELQTKENAATTIEGAGGKITRKSYPILGPALAVDLSGKQLSPQIFDQLVQAGTIAELNLSNTNLTDGDMKRVNGVVGTCGNLNLSNTAISDTGLGELNNMLAIRELNLAGTQCTQAGVDALKKRLQEHPIYKPKPNVKLK
jgi:hypothetical protein